MRRIVQTDTHADSCMQTTCVPCWSCLLCLTSRKPRATCLNRVREQQTQRQNAGGICCRGRDEQQSSSERQGLAGACPGRSVWGLYWPGGFTAWLGVFSVSKLGWCESMTGVRNHRNEAEETKGFHHTPRCRVEIHAIKIITLSTKTSDSTTPSPIKSLLLYNLCCLDRNIEKQGLPLSIFQFSFCLKSSAWVKRWVKDSYTVRNMLQLLLWEVCITGVSV